MTALAMDISRESGDQRIAQAQAGSLDAFNELVRSHELQVYRICYRITREKEAAEDATQETFISAWKNIGRVSPESFRPWLFRIAINASKSQLRKRRQRDEASLDAVYERESEGPTPEQSSLRQALKNEVEVALSQIPSAQRDAIILWHHLGFNYGEIAQITGTSFGTVKSRLFRGRAHLSRLISREALIGN